MPLADSGTILTLTDPLNMLGLPFYSARALNQTLEPMQSLQNNRNNLRRTINGTLMDLTPIYLRKYASKISANDVQPPSLDGVFPGHIVIVGCAAELGYPTGGTPQRQVVHGSSRAESGAPFTFYRPLLTMMVVSVTSGLDEWQDGHPWAIELEEV